MKKILLLGGSRYLLPVIEMAHSLGYYTITCDYLPDNIAHQYSDEYHNVSITNKEAVLELAKQLSIDGISSFGCDPGVVTAAYVAENLGLPFPCSYKVACILQDKGEFRSFLRRNGFNCPWSKSYNSLDTAMKEAENFEWPVIVKPVDSAGSKGVTCVEGIADLHKAIKIAQAVSLSGRFIVEQFIVFKGFHTVGDCFTKNGKLVSFNCMDNICDKNAENPYTPTITVWPASMAKEDQVYLEAELQRLFTLLEMKNGIYNVESCVGSDGKPYIMEVSPRGGGGQIARIQKCATGVDLIKAEIQSAMGALNCSFEHGEYDGVWCEYVIHNTTGTVGKFKQLIIDPKINQKYIKLVDSELKPGAWIEHFTGANKSLGDMFLRFDSREELDDVMQRVPEWLHIVLES